MSEKRFTIKSTATELELYDNGVKIGEFPHYEWVARPVDYVVKTLNEQQDKITELERKIDRQESLINIILNNLPIHQAADIQKFVVESLKEGDS